MGTKEQDMESTQSPMTSRDVELTNDSLLGQNGGTDGQKQAAAAKPENGNGADRPRHTIKRRKIRVELIKDGGDRKDEKPEAAGMPQEPAPAAAEPLPAPEPRKTESAPRPAVNGGGGSP